MGEYTPDQLLYKVDANEIVDVETNLNYNWSRLDTRVKKLIGWYPSDAVSVISSETNEEGYKYLKRRSNALFNTWKDPGSGLMTGYQDAGAYCTTWNLCTPSTGYAHEANAFMMWTEWPDGTIHLRGKCVSDTGAELPIKSGFNITTLPAAARPLVTKQFHRMGGDTGASNLSCMRVSIGTDGVIQCQKYGNAQGTSASHRYVSLAAIRYPKDTT